MHSYKSIIRIIAASYVILFAITGIYAQSSNRLTLQDLLSAEPIGDAVLAPDGKSFALIRSGQIALLPSEGGWPVTLTSTQGGKSGIAWSPDGTQLAYISQGSIWSVPVSGGPPPRLTKGSH